MPDRSYHRTYLRYPMRCPVIYGWESCVGEGLLTNLSFSGCSVLCHHMPLAGTAVRVSILLPDQAEALSIEGGTIQWAEGHLFGLEFLHLPLHIRQRLNRTLRQALIHRLQPRSDRPDRAHALNEHRIGD